FGGDGNDIITGGTALPGGGDAVALGSGDIYVGGKGDDLLINYGVGDTSATYNSYAANAYIFNIGDGNDTIDDRGGGNRLFSGDRIIIDTKG
ncbi:hypothetical protein ABTC69_18310, partial [Acinetobacter baumannii]